MWLGTYMRAHIQTRNLILMPTYTIYVDNDIAMVTKSRNLITELSADNAFYQKSDRT